MSKDLLTKLAVAQQKKDDLHGDLFEMPTVAEPTTAPKPVVEKPVEEPFVLTPEHQTVLELIKQKTQVILLTGKAGTGKSRFLREVLMNKIDDPVLLAPTGIAAINVGGQTIHSFFKINPFEYDMEKMHFDSRLQDILYSVDTIIIDEISMVSGFIMDVIDFRLKQHTTNIEDSKLPFGGKRIIMIGDPFQLPPVVGKGKIADSMKELYGKEAPYFFDALVFNDHEQPVDIKKIEFKKVFRQKDPIFLSVLNSIREGNVTEDELEIVNRRVMKNPDNKSINLVTTNDTADSLNRGEMSKIDSPSVYIKAVIEGNFSKGDYPASEELELKVGARIMMLKNNFPDYQNGSLGVIKDIVTGRFSDPLVTVELDNGNIVEVGMHKWDKYEYDVNPKSKRIERNKNGSFTQLPLKLAFAITIHKSQGQTFDNVRIDMGFGAFAFGQTYVALSRCKTLEGITLQKRVKMKDIFVDPSIQSFMTDLVETPELHDHSESEISGLREEIELLQYQILEKQKRIVALGGTI